MANWQRVKGWRVFAVREFGFSPYIERGAQQLQSTSCRLRWNLILPVKYSLYLLRGWADSWELQSLENYFCTTSCFGSWRFVRTPRHHSKYRMFSRDPKRKHTLSWWAGILWTSNSCPWRWFNTWAWVKIQGPMGQRCWPIGQILRHFGDPILTHAHILFDCVHPWLMAGGSPKPFGFTSPLAAPTPGERESGLGVHHSGSSDFNSFPRTNGEVCWFWAPD